MIQVLITAMFAYCAVLIRLHARAILRDMGFDHVTFLEFFAIKNDALLSYYSAHYQDHSVNRAPIHCALRAQADISGYASEVRHRHWARTCFFSCRNSLTPS